MFNKSILVITITQKLVDFSVWLIFLFLEVIILNQFFIQNFCWQLYDLSYYNSFACQHKTTATMYAVGILQGTFILGAFIVSLRMIVRNDYTKSLRRLAWGMLLLSAPVFFIDALKLSIFFSSPGWLAITVSFYAAFAIFLFGMHLSLISYVFNRVYDSILLPLLTLLHVVFTLHISYIVMRALEKSVNEYTIGLYDAIPDTMKYGDDEVYQRYSETLNVLYIHCLCYIGIATILCLILFKLFQYKQDGKLIRLDDIRLYLAPVVFGIVILIQEKYNYLIGENTDVLMLFLLVIIFQIIMFYVFKLLTNMQTALNWEHSTQILLIITFLFTITASDYTGHMFLSDQESFLLIGLISYVVITLKFLIFGRFFKKVMLDILTWTLLVVFIFFKFMT